MTKKRKITMSVLIILLALGLIGTLIFRLPGLGVEWARLILGNSITGKVRTIYWDCYPSLMNILIAFANVVYAVKGVYLIYKEKMSTSKGIIGYLIYTIISLGAIVVHCITFDYAFSAMIAG